MSAGRKRQFVAQQQDFDPYNQPSSRTQQQQHYDPGASHYALLESSEHQVPQLVYDSMSTILEVDSEDSELAQGAEEPQAHLARSRRPQSPLEISTQIDSQHQAGGSPLSGLSPEDKFSGTLSALSQQMERLRRLSASKPAAESPNLPNDTDSSTASNQQQQRDAATSTSSSSPLSSLRQDEPSSRSSSAASSQQQQQQRLEELRVEPRDEAYEFRQRRSGEQQTGSKSRSASAESLMMIALSPVGSPRIKLPQYYSYQYEQANKDKPTSVVEVSNKSTITKIDLSLMDKMVEKYFVDTRDKATQSIEFDCEDNANTIGFSSKDGSLTRRTKGQVARPPMKSIGVGTEKFSRERFSLLPTTKTRSTQTKSNMDNDIGTSETRRYKLSHFDLGTVIRRPSAGEQTAERADSLRDIEQESLETERPKGSPSEPDRGEAQGRNLPGEHKTNSRGQDVLGDGAGDDVRRATSRATSTTPTFNETGGRGKSKAGSSEGQPAEGTNENSNKQVALVSESSVSEGNTSSPSDSLQEARSLAQPEVQVKGQASDSKAGRTSDDESGEEANKSHASNQQLIPNVKTELRVIIEFNNNSNNTNEPRQRQLSEVTSCSELIDGKLSKKTEVSTSKQMMATPREVLNKLQLAGRAHSLLYANGARRDTQTEASSFGSRELARSAPKLAASSEAGPPRWRELSKSSVCNEIETDINKRRRAGDNAQASALVMSSDATIEHDRTLDKSAIGLKSRAVRRSLFSGSEERRAHTSERVLVESEANFDESKVLEGSQQAERPASSSQLPGPAGQRSQLDGRSAREDSSQHRSRLVGDKVKPLSPRSPRLGLETRRSAGEKSPSVQGGSSPDQLRDFARPASRQQIEFEQETEDRRQVTSNGRLVFDDRLRERRYESAQSPSAPEIIQRSPQPQVSPAGGGQHGGILKRQQQLLRPISLRNAAASPLQQVDQTSNLSSDPETMDSGFAQSGGGGSSSVLNQTHRLQSHQNNKHLSSPAGRTQTSQQPTSRPEELEADGSSLTFVDDDADDLINQIEGSTQSIVAPRRTPLAGQSAERQRSPKGARPRVATSPMLAAKYPTEQEGRRPVRGSVEAPDESMHAGKIPSPPPAFRSSEPALNRLQPDQNQQPAKDTELTTKLTRSRRLASSEQGNTKSLHSRRTRTKLEQSLVAPNSAPRNQQTVSDDACRFRAQVLFESDTDSMATDRQSMGSSSKQSRLKKELISETKFARHESAGDQIGRPGKAGKREEPKGRAWSESQPGQAQVFAQAGHELAPHWDYSLRVNRMRGRKVDSKVNTYIKHSRQPMVNSEVS